MYIIYITHDYITILLLNVHIVHVDIILLHCGPSNLLLVPLICTGGAKGMTTLDSEIQNVPIAQNLFYRVFLSYVIDVICVLFGVNLRSDMFN